MPVMLVFMGDADGQPHAPIDPVPPGTPNTWLALDVEAQRALMFLLQCCQSSTTIRDTARVLPLSWHAAQDGLRIALEKNAPLVMALDPNKRTEEVTDADLGGPAE